MNALQASDDAAAAVAVAPRVSLSDIEKAIAERHDTTAAAALAPAAVAEDSPLQILSLCILVMRNGFVVIGKSAPASRENFNPELGREFAYQDAVRQLWPLMGYALRDRLHANASAVDAARPAPA